MRTDESFARSTTGRRGVHVVLRSGLVVALALMIVGMTTKLASGDHRDTSVELFQLRHTASVGDALMGTGIAVLAATPAVRVLLLIASWGWERDWRFVAVGLSVVATLTMALVLGGG